MFDWLSRLSEMPLEAQAAWAQAIFSVLAIGVAIAIPAVQHLRDSRSRKSQETREARALALLLVPTLNTWIEKLQSYTRTLDSHADAHFPGTVEWTSIAEALVLGEQGKLLAQRSHLMGIASDNAQRFFYLLASAQESAREYGQKTRNRMEDQANVARLSITLKEASASASAARASIRKLYDGRLT